MGSVLRYNPQRFTVNSMYQMQECIDDGSRHGAFLSARRQVYRPQGNNDRSSMEGKPRKEYYGARRPYGSYEERCATVPGTKAQPESPECYDMASNDNENIENYPKTYVKRKAHSKERDQKAYSDRYSSTLERSKSLRSEMDPSSRRPVKARIDTASRNRTGGPAGAEAIRKERKTQLIVERTDSSDIDHEPKEWSQSSGKRKGPNDQFETPPRFERISGSNNTSSITVDGLMTSKKIGVTRPFVLNNSNQSKETNLDSDHQIGYIASEEQDVSDSAGNSSFSGTGPFSINKVPSSASIASRGNKRYSAARRVSPPVSESIDGSTLQPTQSIQQVYNSSNSNLSGSNNSSRTNSFSMTSSMGGYVHNTASNAAYALNPSMTPHARAMGVVSSNPGYYPSSSFMPSSHASNGTASAGGLPNASYHGQSMLASHPSNIDPAVLHGYSSATSGAQMSGGSANGAMSMSAAAQLAMASSNPHLNSFGQQPQAAPFPSTNQSPYSSK